MYLYRCTHTLIFCLRCLKATFSSTCCVKGWICILYIVKNKPKCHILILILKKVNLLANKYNSWWAWMFLSHFWASAACLLVWLRWSKISPGPSKSLSPFSSWFSCYHSCCACQHVKKTADFPKCAGGFVPFAQSAHLTQPNGGPPIFWLETSTWHLEFRVLCAPQMPRINEIQNKLMSADKSNRKYLISINWPQLPPKQFAALSSPSPFIFSCSWRGFDEAKVQK